MTIQSAIEKVVKTNTFFKRNIHTRWLYIGALKHIFCRDLDATAIDQLYHFTSEDLVATDWEIKP